VIKRASSRTSHSAAAVTDVPGPAAQQWWVAVAVYATVQIVYVLTMFPTVAHGDTGALISVVYNMGIAHPPGYPLYTLLGKLFTFIPIGSIAWRVNLASTFYGAAAAALLFVTMLRLTRRTWASLLAAGLFAFSPLTWQYSILAEVFSLNNLFAALIALVALSYHQSRRRPFLFVLAFVTGLGFSHHQTIAFWAAPVWGWLLWVEKGVILNVGTIGRCAGFFVLGLTPFLYMPLAALRDPLVVWGDVSTPTGFVRHVLRSDYGSFSLIPGATGQSGDVGRALAFYFRHLASEVLFVGLPLAVLGVYQGLRNISSRGFVAATVVSFTAYVITFHTLARLPMTESSILAAHIQKFWLLPNIFVCLWAGLGLYAIGSRWRRLEVLWWGVALAVVVVQVGVHYKGEDQSDNWLFHDHAKLKLEHLPDRAILLTNGDTDSHTLQYLNDCERLREDVTVLKMESLFKYYYNRLIEKHAPDVVLPGDILYPSMEPVRGVSSVEIPGLETGSGVLYSLSYLFDANIERRPIYAVRFQRNRLFKNAQSWKRDYVLIPTGTIQQVRRKTDRLSFQNLLAEATSHLPPIETLQKRAFEEGTWEYFTWSRYWRDYQDLFAVLTRVAMESGAEKRRS
jgi:hypothetical protein